MASTISYEMQFYVDQCDDEYCVGVNTINSIPKKLHGILPCFLDTWDGSLLTETLSILCINRRESANTTIPAVYLIPHIVINARNLEAADKIEECWCGKARIGQLPDVSDHYLGLAQEHYIEKFTEWASEGGDPIPKGFYSVIGQGFMRDPVSLCTADPFHALVDESEVRDLSGSWFLSKTCPTCREPTMPKSFPVVQAFRIAIERWLAANLQTYLDNRTPAGSPREHVDATWTTAEAVNDTPHRQSTAPRRGQPLTGSSIWVRGRGVIRLATVVAVIAAFCIGIYYSKQAIDALYSGVTQIDLKR